MVADVAVGTVWDVAVHDAEFGTAFATNLVGFGLGEVGGYAAAGGLRRTGIGKAIGNSRAVKTISNSRVGRAVRAGVEALDNFERAAWARHQKAWGRTFGDPRLRITNGITGSPDGDEFITLYRGTDRTAEIEIFDDTGYIMSDAAQRGYRESGFPQGGREAIDAGQQVSEIADARYLQIFDGSRSDYVQAHSMFGTELQEAYGPRSMISFTENEHIARTFGSTVFEVQVPRNQVFRQTHSDALDPENLEYEYLITHMVRGRRLP
jgi:hypothetical protein